jgi:hypothetical protein
MVTIVQQADGQVSTAGVGVYQYGPAGPACPVSLGDPGRFLQHLCFAGDLYGRNTSAAGAPVQSITFPGFSLVTTWFSTSGSSSVLGVAVYPDGTLLVTERIPSGSTSHGNVGPLGATYRIDPDTTITTLATYAMVTTKPLIYSDATGKVYCDNGTTIAEIDPTTGAETTVETISGSDMASTTDGALWFVVSTTAVTRYDPVADTQINITGLDSYVSTLIPVGTSVWVPQLLGTGYQIDSAGNVTDQPCMTGFPAMSEAAYDLLDPSRSVCEDSSPRELYVIE